jgi:hypothetical protein
LDGGEAQILAAAAAIPALALWLVCRDLKILLERWGNEKI